jgi:multiple sugar transport system substrate-binding protein
MTLASPRRRRVALPIVGASVSLLLLAGCSSGGSPAPSESGFAGTELTVWSSIDFDPYMTLQEGYFKACAEELEITVDVQTQSGDYLTSLLQGASSGTMPDVSLLSSDTQIPQLASQGVLADLGELGVTTEGMDDVVADLGTYEGTLYGLPVQVENYSLFYNKDAFAAAGIETPPATFDELVETAAALTTDTQDGIVLPGIGGDGSTPVYFLPFLLSAGGDPADPTSEGSIAAVELYKSLVADGSLSNEFVNWGWDSIDQWTSGAAAITVSGPWNLVDSSIPFEYGTAPIPTLESGESAKVGLLGYSYAVAANEDPNREAAAAALIECRASEENQIETAIQGGYIPALTSAQDAFIAEVPAAQSFVDSITGAYNSAQLGTEWNVLQQQYVDAIQNATVNGDSAEDAVQKALAG